MPSDNDPSGSSNDPTHEKLAAFIAMSFVHNAADAAAEWLRDGATALDASLSKALAGEYTSSDLVKDSAALWARSARQVLRLLPSSPPDEGTDEL